MPTPLLMPALSPTMEEGTLSKWNVKVGDTVSSGDIIAEIETDKATMEVEAVDEGTVGKILVDEGTEGVKVNALIAVLLDDGETMDGVDLDALGGSGPSPEGAKTPSTSPKGEVKLETPTAQNLSLGRGRNGEAVSGEGKAANANTRILASPLAKRMAQADGINLAAVNGSGPRGRIVKRDIEKAKVLAADL